jgi:hypothetical protein
MSKTETIFAKIRNETKVSILSTLIQYSDWILSQSSKARERNQRDKTKKERSQIIPISWQLRCYIWKTLKTPPKKNS